MTSVALLGTGIMGAGMARSMRRAGLDLAVWNRSPDKAAPLAEVGARVAGSAAAAVEGADVVITMLFDVDSVADTMSEVFGGMAAGSVWAQMCTVGIDGIRRLGGMADEHGINFVDAPVLGTRKPAEQGALTVLASGPSALADRVQPVFDAVGATTVWVGERPGASSRLKLVLNAWVLSLTAATAQSVALARGLGLDPQLFLSTIEGGATDSPYAQLKGAAMLAGEFPPAFGLDGAVKDGELIVAALHDAGVDDSLMAAVHGRLQRAAEQGHGREDMAVVLHAFGP